jgi:hypothetical protein
MVRQNIHLHYLIKIQLMKIHEIDPRVF